MKTNATSSPRSLSAEEQRWRAAAEDPARVKRHLKTLYVLAGIWCGLTAGWGDSRHVQGSSVHMDKHHCPVLHVSEHRYRHRKQSAHTGPGKRPW